jgi:hypothetical protein
METQARISLGAPVERVLVQGVDAEQAGNLALVCGLNVEAIPGPALDGDTIAGGLAVAGLDASYKAPNMAMSLQAPDTLWSIINHFEAGIVALAVLVMIGALYFTAGDTQRRFSLIWMDNQRFKGANRNNTELNKEREEQRKLAESFAGYLNRPFDFTAALVAVAQSVPPEAKLKKISIRNGPMNPGGPPGDRAVMLTVESPEERPVLNGFREHKYLQRVFPSARLGGLARVGGQVTRTFTLEGYGAGLVTAGEGDPPRGKDVGASAAPSPPPAGSKPASPAASPAPGASPSPAASPSPKAGG